MTTRDGISNVKCVLNPFYLLFAPFGHGVPGWGQTQAGRDLENTVRPIEEPMEHCTMEYSSMYELRAMRTLEVKHGRSHASSGFTRL